MGRKMNITQSKFMYFSAGVILLLNDRYRIIHGRLSLKGSLGNAICNRFRLGFS